MTQPATADLRHAHPPAATASIRQARVTAPETDLRCRGYVAVRVVEHVVVRRASVEIGEHCLCLRGHMRGFVVLTMKPLTLSRVLNRIRVMNSTSWSRSRRINSMERKPGMRRASMPGITSPRTMRSYASALSLVVHPRHTRQIMDPELTRLPRRRPLAI